MPPETIDVSSWAAGGQLVMSLAQIAANRMCHAYTSGAHVAKVLLEMQPVRALLGQDELSRIDAGVERALMVAEKSAGKNSILSDPLLRILTGNARTTVDFLQGVLGGVKTMADAEVALKARAGAIAELLDRPLLGELLRAPGAASTFRTLPALAVAHSMATERGHRTITTRHGIAAFAHMCHRSLVSAGGPGIEDLLARAIELLDPVAARRDDATLYYAPRFVGAVATALAATERIHASFQEACFAGDDGVGSLRDPLREAAQRYAAMKKAASS